MIGRTFGQYRVIETLGQGGMGTVYLAEDTQLGRKVAIKVISGAAHTDPAARARFLQEARAASGLDHPNICAIYQIGETDEGAPFLVMAHYAGETLDRRIAAGPMPLGEAVKLAAQVADGLAHAHARGVIHRDIKPSNVLRTSDGVAKILDFGLAKVIGAESMTVTGVSVGTPSYMSPEQVRAESVDARSDVWAVGVLLYALLAGRSPFEAENLGAVTFAILDGTPRPLRDLFPRVPEGLQPIVDRCLAKEPADRYPDARALAADLHRLADQLTSDDAHTMAGASVTSGMKTLRVPSTPRRSATTVRRRSPVPLVIGGIVLAAAVALGVVAWLRAHPPEPLRVAVMAPTTTGAADSGETELASSAALSSTLGFLSDRRGIAALDASNLRGVSSGLDAARALAADEFVTLALESTRSEWRIELRRMSARDSSVVSAASFTAGFENPLALASAVRGRLATAFAGHPSRSRRPDPRIEATDYAEYLRLERSYRTTFANEIPPDSMYAMLAGLRGRSSDFIEVPLLEADYGNHHYETGKRPEDLARATEAGEAAHRLAPEDPRPLTRLFTSALFKGDSTAARTWLGALRQLTPGDPDVTYLEARLAESDGRVDEGIAMLKRLVARRPSRNYYERLARMEYNSGRYDDARTHLDYLARRFPTNVFPRAQLAQLELLYGFPQRAESLYAALAAERPQVGYLSNLGLAQMLLGKFSDCARVFEQALGQAPDNPAVLLNLADSRQLLGQTGEAAKLYRRVLAIVRADPASGTWDNALMMAQCEAHLGMREAAVALVQDVLRTEQKNPDARFQAALVYVVIGENTSAIVNVRQAVENGIQPRWFGLPWFDPIRKDPGFVGALGEAKTGGNP